MSNSLGLAELRQGPGARRLFIWPWACISVQVGSITDSFYA